MIFESNNIWILWFLDLMIFGSYDFPDFCFLWLLIFLCFSHEIQRLPAECRAAFNVFSHYTWCFSRKSLNRWYKKMINRVKTVAPPSAPRPVSVRCKAENTLYWVCHKKVSVDGWTEVCYWSTSSIECICSCNVAKTTFQYAALDFRHPTRILRKNMQNI